MLLQRGGNVWRKRGFFVVVVLMMLLVYLSVRSIMRQIIDSSSSSSAARTTTTTSRRTEEDSCEMFLFPEIVKEFLQQQQESSSRRSYNSSFAEQYIFNHITELGFNACTGVWQSQLTPSCLLWRNQTTNNVTIGSEEVQLFRHLTQYREEIKKYKQAIDDIQQPVPDLRQQLRAANANRTEICAQVDLGLPEIFQSSSKLLSRGNDFGWIEPLFPPFRHFDLCFEEPPVPQYIEYKALYHLDYLVHDFHHICINLQPHARTILIDMGASLDFHNAVNRPAVFLTDLYHKFGLSFDHVYAFEVTPKPNVTRLYESLPKHLLSSYHWINAGVSADPNSRLNPLGELLMSFTRDDFVVVKLDIDTPELEVPLAQQLLLLSSSSSLVDVFYFEHHVHLHELAPYWKERTMRGSVQESLALFHGLRAQKGIASHYWV